MCPQDADVDRALAAWRQGDQGAVEDLFRLVYDELKVLARRRLRRRAGESLGAAALVHEVYLRFAERSSPVLLDRNHFAALAARAMRMVIVDHWRRKQARKRDPQAPVSASLDDVAVPNAMPLIDVLALDEALRRLSELDAGGTGRAKPARQPSAPGALAMDSFGERFAAPRSAPATLRIATRGYTERP